MNSADASQRPVIVTIDGPAGSGKTTVSKMVAQRLGYRYLDTGALYRAVAVAAVDAGVAADDDDALTNLCAGITIDLQTAASGSRVMLDDRDITDRIRTPQISMMASAVSARPVVRDFLMATQRDLGARKGVVAEGRDMGTVVFPEAGAKFFLYADERIRAQRRYEELNTDSSGPSLADVEKDMHQRDRNDSTRKVAPLQPAPDAVRIDSSNLTLDQVVETILQHVRGPHQR